MTTTEDPVSIPSKGRNSFQRSNTTDSAGRRESKGSFCRRQTEASVRMDHSDPGRSSVGRSLTGDLDDIVNSVARRAGRRQKRNNVEPPSPIRRNRAVNPEAKPVRVPRSQRRASQEAGEAPALKNLDISERDAATMGDISLGENNLGNSSKRDNGDSNGSFNKVGSSSLKRMSTVDSRNRFIKMLEVKTLTSFRHLNNQKVENNKPQTYMSRLFVTFQDCLEQLGAGEVSDRKLEAMAILIHECMSGDSRNYHSVQHVFEISKGFTDNPLAVLAAMFHDCIYLNVDAGLNAQQEEILHGCFEPNEEKTTNSNATTTQLTCCAHRTCDTDIPLCMVETIFGYKPGEEITAMKGLNEFLSAVVAVRQLKEHLSSAHCAKIAGCIAATIPFKNKRVEGEKTHMERLYENMVVANDKFNLGMLDDEIVEAVQMACIVANADVGNFGSDDIYYFLDNTWSLLTETNTTLRRSFLFTVMEFQHSLYKMNGFFHFLDPSAIFASFQNVPNNEEITRLTEQARTNLKLGQKYVGAKLLSASVLAAFAALTGGDAPLSMFVGDLPSRHHQSQSINDALPQAGDKPLFAGDDDEIQDHLDMLVYQILSGGRRSETSFDVKQSPLGAFLYAVVGDRGLTMILEKRDLYPMTEENARELLSCLPREVVRYLAKTIASVAISRSEAIMDVVDNLPARSKKRIEEQNLIAEEEPME